MRDTVTSTLPRTMARSTEVEMTPARDKITAATSSASLYDNVNNTNVTPGKTPKAGESKQKEKQNETYQTAPKTANVGIETVTVGSQVNHLITSLYHHITYYDVTILHITYRM